MDGIRASIANTWFDDGGRARVLEEIGEVDWEAGPLAPAGAVTCGVCWGDFEPQDITGNRCGHHFCNECWARHMAAQTSEGNSRIACMEMGCRLHVRLQL